MRLNKLKILALACALPLTALADPNGGSGKQGGGPGTRSGGGDRVHNNQEGNGKSYNDWSPAQREQFKKDVADFCKENSPNRWKEMNRVSGKEAERKIGGMAIRFHMLQGIKQQDANLYDIKVRQIRVEDDEFGLLQALVDPKDAEKNASKQTADELRSQLRETAQRSVQLRLDERRHRIESAAKILEHEKAELAADEGRTDRLTEDRYDALIKQGPSLFPFPGPRRGGDDGRRDGGRPNTVNNASPEPGNAPER